MNIDWEEAIPRILIPLLAFVIMGVCVLIGGAIGESCAANKPGGECVEWTCTQELR